MIEPKNSPRYSFWKNTSLIFKALILGLIISLGGVMVWPLLASFIPMPWSVVLMIVLLFFYIKYLSGSWKPESTIPFRKNMFRSTRLSSEVWLYSILGIVLIVLIEQSVLILTFRFIDFPAERFLQAYDFFANLPVWMSWIVIIMISLVAGICEEIGFRGYMQVPLEKKYGPGIAISIVSVVFVLVHLHQAWSGPLLLHIFFISVLFGLIAYSTGSLIPGIIAHFIMDIFNFTFWWTDLGYQFDKNTISETGIDNHFIIWTVVFLIGIASFVYVISRLNFMQKRDVT